MIPAWCLKQTRGASLDGPRACVRLSAILRQRQEKKQLIVFDVDAGVPALFFTVRVTV